jgi:hypothetical protein
MKENKKGVLRDSLLFNEPVSNYLLRANFIIMYDVEICSEIKFTDKQIACQIFFRKTFIHASKQLFDLLPIIFLVFISSL